MNSLVDTVGDLSLNDRDEFFKHIETALTYRGRSPGDLAIASVLAELKAAAAVLERNGCEVGEYT